MFRTALSGLYLVTAILVALMLSRPLYTEIQTLRTRVNSINALLADSRGIQAKRDEQLKKYNSISADDRDRLNKLMPAQMDSIRFIMEMEKVVQKSGMLLKDIVVGGNVGNTAHADNTDDLLPSKTKKVTTSETSMIGASAKKKQPYNTIPFTMKISGSYSSLPNFFGNLEENLRLIDTTDFSFTSGEKDFYEFNLGAVIYSK